MKKTLLLSVALFAVTLLGPLPGLAYDGYEDASSQTSSSGDRFYLGFSVGDGTYISYDDSGCPGCDPIIVAPFDFEVLLGFKVGRFLYLDLAANWAIDYFQSYYHEVTFLYGLRPGIRLVFPGLYHRQLYLRAAVPLQYSQNSEKNRLLAGFLVGVGIEWRLDNLGLFAEVDLAPYFYAVYPGYYVIPVQGRLGVSLHF